METDASLTNGAFRSSQTTQGYEYHVDKRRCAPVIIFALRAANDGRHLRLRFGALPGSDGRINSGMMEQFHLDLPPMQLGWTMFPCRSPARPGFRPRTAAP